jgi:hypothetical protein
MSARSFHSVFMVASCAGAALGCYMVSLHVASERSQLEDVESRIVVAQRDMRVLQTEIGTRGRLTQLERWNASVLALSAPGANQFVSGGYELAKLTRNQPTVDFQAPVVLASAPAPERTPALIGQESRDDSGAATPLADPASPSALLHHASLKIESREDPARAVAPVRTPIVRSPATKPIAAAMAAAVKPAAKTTATKLAAKKSVDKLRLAASKPVTKPARLAKTDPLAPLPVKLASKTAKDSGPAR